MAGLLGLSIGLGGGASTLAPAQTPDASVLVGQDPTNLGPLMTTFIPPPACTVAVAGCKTCDSAWFAQSCDGLKGPVDVTSCWPPTSSGAPSTSAPLHGWGFYSPGIACPAGHASACSATGGAGGGSGWPVQFKLLDGETAVGCCPSGFACANIGGQTCVQVATKTTVSTVTCQLGSNAAFGLKTIPDTSASVTAFTMFAPMIQINFQSSDLPSSTAASSALPTPGMSLPLDTSKPPPVTSQGIGQSSPDGDAFTGSLSTTSPGVSTASLTQDSNSGSEGSSIPVGAMAGVGAAAGVALLAVIIAGCCIWQRKIRRKRDAKDAALQNLDSMYEAAKPRDLGGDEYSRYFVRPGPERVQVVEEYSLGEAVRSPVELAGGPVYQPYRPQ